MAGELQIRIAQRSVHRRTDAIPDDGNTLSGPTLLSEPSPSDEETPEAASPQPASQSVAKSAIRLRLERLSTTASFQIFVIICTIYYMFADDARAAFAIVAYVVMVLFAVELALACLANEGRYVGTFHFWPDLVSIVAVVSDIPWLFGSKIGGSVDSDELGSLTITRVSASLVSGRAPSASAACSDSCESSA